MAEDDSCVNEARTAGSRRRNTCLLPGSRMGYVCRRLLLMAAVVGKVSATKDCLCRRWGWLMPQAGSRQYGRSEHFSSLFFYL